MSVIQVWRSLNAEQKQILLDKRIDTSRSVDELLALMKPLAQCDTLADKSRTKLGCTFAAGIVLTFIGFILLVNLAGFTAGALITLVLLATTIAFGYFWSWTKKIDISNNFRQFVLPVLSVFREDIDASKPMTVKIDLSSPTHKSKLQNESAPYSKGVYHKIIDSVYRDPWMSAEAVLVDGTKLSWSVTDVIRERKKTKRNPRGKYKTKTKYVKKTNFEVTVGLRRKLYDVSAPTGAEMTADEKRSVITQERQVLTASLDPVAPKSLFDLIANVYRNARLTKKEASA